MPTARQARLGIPDAFVSINIQAAMHFQGSHLLCWNQHAEPASVAAEECNTLWTCGLCSPQDSAAAALAMEQQAGGSQKDEEAKIKAELLELIQRENVTRPLAGDAMVNRMLSKWRQPWARGCSRAQLGPYLGTMQHTAVFRPRHPPGGCSQGAAALPSPVPAGALVCLPRQRSSVPQGGVEALLGDDQNAVAPCGPPAETCPR